MKDCLGKYSIEELEQQQAGLMIGLHFHDQARLPDILHILNLTLEFGSSLVFSFMALRDYHMMKIYEKSPTMLDM